MRFSLILCLLIAIFGRTAAQSTAYVVGGGLTLGNQRWDDNFNRQLLFAHHLTLAAESINNDDDRYSLFAQIGYHVKGSANRFRFLLNGGGVDQFSEKFKFHNFSMILAAKQRFPLGTNSRYFYYGGIRGDYTWKTNIDELGANNPYAALYYPQVGFLRRWMFGVSAGGGIEFPFSELVGGQLTLSIHPDFTPQYNQPPIPNVINPLFPGTTTTIPERQIRNTTIELSLALRLLRKVIYEE